MNNANKVNHTMVQIVKEFKQELENIFGDRRVTVRIIHDDMDICINSNEREILYAICDQQEKYFKSMWRFSENLYGKALIIPVNLSPKADLTGIAEIYKSYFQKRIQTIITKYDMETLPNISYYKNIKDKYYSLLSKEDVNFEEYKQVRDNFESIRS